MATQSCVRSGTGLTDGTPRFPAFPEPRTGLRSEGRCELPGAPMESRTSCTDSVLARRRIESSKQAFAGLRAALQKPIDQATARIFCSTPWIYFASFVLALALATSRSGVLNIRRSKSSGFGFWRCVLYFRYRGHQ